MITTLGERLKSCSIEVKCRAPLMFNNTTHVTVMKTAYTAGIEVIEDVIGFRFNIASSVLSLDLKEAETGLEGRYKWNIPEIIVTYPVNFAMYTSNEIQYFQDITTVIGDIVGKSIVDYIFNQRVPSMEGVVLTSLPNNVDIPVVFGTTY